MLKIILILISIMLKLIICNELIFSDFESFLVILSDNDHGGTF